MKNNLSESMKVWWDSIIPNFNEITRNRAVSLLLLMFVAACAKGQSSVAQMTCTYRNDTGPSGFSYKAVGFDGKVEVAVNDSGTIRQIILDQGSEIYRVEQNKDSDPILTVYFSGHKRPISDIEEGAFEFHTKLAKQACLNFAEEPTVHPSSPLRTVQSQIESISPNVPATATTVPTSETFAKPTSTIQPSPTPSNTVQPTPTITVLPTETRQATDVNLATIPEIPILLEMEVAVNSCFVEGEGQNRHFEIVMKNGYLSYTEGSLFSLGVQIDGELYEISNQSGNYLDSKGRELSGLEIERVVGYLRKIFEKC